MATILFLFLYTCYTHLSEVEHFNKTSNIYYLFFFLFVFFRLFFGALVVDINNKKMTTATPMSVNSKIQEQFEEINENDTGRVSVGVGRDTTSVVSPKQKVISTTVRDECVCY